VKTQDEIMENRINKYLALVRNSQLLRDSHGRIFERCHLYSLGHPLTKMLMTTWLLGLYGAGLMFFGWWFMCGYVPTLPQPLPPLINWSIISVLSVFAAAVDKIRKGEKG